MSLYKFDVSVSSPRTHHDDLAFGKGLYLKGTLSNNILTSTICKLEKIFQDEVEEEEFEYDNLYEVHIFAMKVLRLLPSNASRNLESRKITFSNNGTIFLNWSKSEISVVIEIGTDLSTYAVINEKEELAGHFAKADSRLPQQLVKAFEMF